MARAPVPWVAKVKRCRRMKPTTAIHPSARRDTEGPSHKEEHRCACRAQRARSCLPHEKGNFKNSPRCSRSNVLRSSELHTDESRLYVTSARNLPHIRLLSTARRQGYYVGQTARTQTPLKISSVISSAHERHLPLLQRTTSARYLSEFEFRHNHRSGLGFTDGERTGLLSGVSREAPDVPAD